MLDRDIVLLDDRDIARLIDPDAAVAVMRHALARHAEGTLTAAPRTRAALTAQGQNLVFGVGHAAGRAYGFRCYDTLVDSPDQLTAVWSPATGRLRGIVVGRLLGEYRTGALGALAIEAVRGGRCGPLAVLGCGRQAWAQMWALSATVAPLEVRVFSRDRSRREAFAVRLSSQFGWRCASATDARAAVDAADVVVLATDSPVPVVEPEWIGPGAHVSTIGPKTAVAHECPPALQHQGRVVLTDSVSQARCYPGGNLLPEQLRELCRLGQEPGLDTMLRRRGSVYLSVGLTGTEILLADYAFSRYARRSLNDTKALRRIAGERRRGRFSTERVRRRIPGIDPR